MPSRATRRGRTAAGGGAGAARRWPLVGRTAELHRIVEHLRAAPGRSVVIAGPAGVGKSRLASEAAPRVAAVATLTVERALATEAAATIPFGAFAHLLPASVPPSADRLQLLQEVRRAILARAEPGRLLLVVDDAHLLDPGSATLAQQLAAGGQVRLVATVRTGEAIPDSVRALWKEQLATRVDLTTLSRSATDELVSAVLGGRVEHRTRHQLWDLSRGNPLFLRELVDGAREEGILVRDHLWRLIEPPVPSTRLVELIGARLARLDHDDRSAAELIALGEPLPLHALEALSGEDAAERLEAHGIARLEQVDERTQVRLAHPLHGEVLRSGMVPARRRRLAARLADALTTAGTPTGARRRDTLLRLAVLRLEAGEASDPTVLLEAATTALSRFDHPLAERLARAALANGTDDVEARIVLGEALAGQNRADEAEQVFAAAAGDGGDDVAMGRLAVARAQNLFFGLRQPAEARAVLSRARATVTDAAWDQELTALLAVIATLTGDTAAGAKATERVLARPAANPRAVVATLVASTICQLLLGEVRGVKRPLEVGGRLAEQVTHELPLAATQLAVTEAGLAWWSGHGRDALQRCRTGYSGALRRGQDDLAGVWAASTAQLQSFGAAPAEDIFTVAAEAVGLLRARDALGLLPMALGCQGYAAAQLGDVSTAQRLLDDSVLDAVDAELRSEVFALRARAWLRVCEGHRASTAAQLVDAGRRVIDGGIRVWGGVLLHDVVRLGFPELVHDDLAALCDIVDGPLAAVWSAQARALVDGDSPRLEAVAATFAGHGLPVYAAEAAVQAADLHRRAGRHRAARRAAALASGWDPASASQGSTAAPHPLTRREHEVATMAARGLTSPEIAEALVVSTRTVDNHLRAVYRKLGVRGRGDLAEVLNAGSE